MKSITSKALKLSLSIKKSIRDHYLGDASFIEMIYEGEYNNDELENYYYLTYKDYDKLRLIIVNILHLILYDLKNKKRKHKKKIINLMDIFNNTYIYFTYPKNIYLCKFQRFVNNTLFIYYKDYVYKAQLQYPSINKLPISVVITSYYNYYEQEHDPIQLKILPALCKKILYDNLKLG